MDITITKSITDKLPGFDIIALSMDIVIQDSSEIQDLVKQIEQKTAEEYSLSTILNIPLIKEARDAYKKLKKDPSRYRLACESLLRRLVKGNGLYLINNVVDTGNVLSILCHRSVAVLDYDRIVGPVRIRIGSEADDYIGIGRGKIDVSNIPVYEDEIGPFGSTTSDTLRTAVTDATKKILLFIICFGPSYKQEHEDLAISLFKKYGKAQNISKITIRKE